METVQIECRCKDCEHYGIINSHVGYCYAWLCDEGSLQKIVKKDDFCSNGVRK